MKKLHLLQFFLVFLLVLTSCSSDGEEEVPVVNQLTVETSSGLDVLKGQSTPFIIKNEKGDDVTHKATIYVNGEKINGITYTFDESKNYQVYAEIGDVKTPVVSINVVEPTHTTKVLVEDYTGMWCPYCPRLAYKLDELAKKNSNVIPVALHDDKNWNNALTFSGVANMMKSFNVTVFPSGRINRIYSWDESETQVLNYLKKRKNLGLAISSSINGSEITAEVKVHYDIKSSTENKLVVYLLENGLVAAQANYFNNDPSSPWYQKGNPIEDFVHNHTARTTFTNKFGDVIPAEEIKTNTTYKKTFTVAIPAEVKDNNKLELVAFVVNAKKEVINVQKAKVGVTKDFD